jgi:hypothetical protein
VGIGPEEEPWSQPLLKATLARVAVEKEAAQLRERLATAERERDAALGLLLMHHDTHDQGHSPCACAWSQTFLAASKGGGK